MEMIYLAKDGNNNLYVVEERNQVEPGPRFALKALPGAVRKFTRLVPFVYPDRIPQISLSHIQDLTDIVSQSIVVEGRDQRSLLLRYAYDHTRVCNPEAAWLAYLENRNMSSGDGSSEEVFALTQDLVTAIKQNPAAIGIREPVKNWFEEVAFCTGFHSNSLRQVKDYMTGKNDDFAPEGFKLCQPDLVAVTDKRSYIIELKTCFSDRELRGNTSRRVPVPAYHKKEAKSQLKKARWFLRENWDLPARFLAVIYYNTRKNELVEVKEYRGDDSWDTCRSLFIPSVAELAAGSVAALA